MSAKNCPSDEPQVVSCEVVPEEGLLFVKVVGACSDPVEFDTTSARALASNLLEGARRVEAGWVGRSVPSCKFVLLASTAVGAQEAIAIARVADCAVWLGADAVSDDIFASLCADGLCLTRFAHSLQGASPEVLADAMDTIAEHHPGRTIWIQGHL